MDRKPDYEREGVRLYHADCLDILPGLEGVAAIITDPPYGIDYQSARRTDRAKWKPKIANDGEPFIAWLPSSVQACRSDACLLCFCRWDVQEDFRGAIDEAGWEVKAQLIWDRVVHGMGDLNGTPAPQHDVIWFASNGGYAFPGDRPKSVVRYFRIGSEQLLHPNQKPESLMEDLAESYAAHGETVLDPFMGSGTTGVACVRTGRKFIGVEIERRYFDIAVKRIDAEIERFPLFEEPPKAKLAPMWAE